MIDLPVNEMPKAPEQAYHEVQQSNTKDCYQLIEVDLSFSNSLGALCSSDTSSGPVSRPKTGKDLLG